MKLSIGVPVYNVERYLRKCVDSLLEQDLSSSEYEIILVDDDSTDACPQICDEYAVAHDNIRVIHQPNAGLSAARNTSISAARGTYIMFVDSDDYLEPNVLRGLMAQVERDNLDVLRFKYQNVNERYEVFLPYKQDARLGNDYSTEVTDGVSFLNTRMNYQCYAVMYIMRREIVPTFTEGIHFEDVDWLPRMMVKAKRVASADTIVYNYLIRQGSITQVQGCPEKTRRNVEDFMYLIDKYNSYMKQEPNCSWLKNMQSSMVSGVLTTIAREFYEERKEYIKRLNEMNIFPLSIANQGRTYKRRARLINISPRLAVELLHWKNGK